MEWLFPSCSSGLKSSKPLNFSFHCLSSLSNVLVSYKFTLLLLWIYHVMSYARIVLVHSTFDLLLPLPQTCDFLFFFLDSVYTLYPLSKLHEHGIQEHKKMYIINCYTILYYSLNVSFTFILRSKLIHAFLGFYKLALSDLQLLKGTLHHLNFLKDVTKTSFQNLYYRYYCRIYAKCTPYLEPVPPVNWTVPKHHIQNIQS